MLAVAHLGIEAVAITGSVIHGLFVGVAYIVLLRGKVESPLRVLWQDLRPATVACIALAGIALVADRGLVAIGAPAVLEILGVAAVGAVAYLAALRWWFPATAGDVASLIGRVLPDRLKFGRTGSVALAES